MTRYAKPTEIDEALALLGEDSWRLLAGGTDFYPALGTAPLRENVLDLNGLGALRSIMETNDHWIIGARATWADIEHHKLPNSFNALKEAAREVGSRQIQNVATVAGNLCNASPAADGVPPLLVLNAEVEIRSAKATRQLPLDKFILGNRRTALQAGEMVSAIQIPKSSTVGRSSFFKLGSRRYLVISIAMAAARLDIKYGVVKEAAISVGSCSAVAVRLPGVEKALKGCKADNTLIDVVASAAIEELAPIDDVRASAGYRLKAAREIIGRAIMAAAADQRESAA